MPRKRSQSERRALLLAIGSVVVALLLLLGLSVLSGRGDVELANLADRDYEVGSAEHFAEVIAEDGPFALPDASPNRDRPIYINHDGFTPEGGWVAILAGTVDCPVQWTGEQFEDCEGESYPPSGEGLTRYETRVEKGRLYVDLRAEVE